MVCWVSPSAEPSDSRPASGVPMFTTIRTSAPSMRATLIGVLFTKPPSPRMCPSTSVGAKTPGTLMLERNARARSPPSMIMGSPVSMSVATARNGMGSASKLATSRTGKV